jgi:hypothetical protein
MSSGTKIMIAEASNRRLYKWVTETGVYLIAERYSLDGNCKTFVIYLGDDSYLHIYSSRRCGLETTDYLEVQLAPSVATEIRDAIENVKTFRDFKRTWLWLLNATYCYTEQGAVICEDEDLDL